MKRVLKTGKMKYSAAICAVLAAALFLCAVLPVNTAFATEPDGTGETVFETPATESENPGETGDPEGTAGETGLSTEVPTETPAPTQVTEYVF